MSIFSDADNSQELKSAPGIGSPIPPTKKLNHDEKTETEYYKTPSFPSLPSFVIRFQRPKKSGPTLGKYSQSEPLLNRRLPKLTLPMKKFPSSSIQRKRKLERKMNSDNWRSNNEQKQLRSKYYPDNSFNLLKSSKRLLNPANFNEMSEGLKGQALPLEVPPRDYAPGKRCGIIPVDTRVDSQGKKIVSLLVVMGRPTILENGRAMSIWSFGKGRMMETETEEKCAIREFWEETGIQISTVNNLPRIELGKNVYFILHTNREAMPIEQSAIEDVLEVQDAAWKTVDELREIERRIFLDQRVNKDVRAIIRYPVRSFYYHKLIFNPETKHPVQDVRDLADKKVVKVGNYPVPPTSEKEKMEAE
jgi:8-oxo-dGTP pyrophosphatase MutT (NUDIX family)